MSTYVSEAIAVVLTIVFAIALIVFFPLMVIWSANTLFPTVLAIPYNFYNWAAVLILGIYIRGVGKTAKGK